jgi:hypothetical protein
VRRAPVLNDSLSASGHWVCNLTVRGREHGADPPAFEGSAPRGCVLHAEVQFTPPVRPYPMPRIYRALWLIGAIGTLFVLRYL